MCVSSNVFTVARSVAVAIALFFANVEAPGHCTETLELLKMPTESTDLTTVNEILACFAEKPLLEAHVHGHVCTILHKQFHMHGCARIIFLRNSQGPLMSKSQGDRCTTLPFACVLSGLPGLICWLPKLVQNPLMLQLLGFAPRNGASRGQTRQCLSSAGQEAN